MQNRGILIALRAAAIIVIVTGVNDVVASAVPRYEPLYLYLAAVALIGLLDGVIVAVASAILSVAFYGLLFMPRADALSSRIVIPVAAAFAVAFVASILRGLVRARRRQHVEPIFTTATAMPLLETTPGNEEVLAAIDGLRDELRAAVAGLGDARGREASLDDELRSARRRTIDAERALAASREEAAAMAGRIAELELSLHEAERFRSEAAIERARAEGEKTLRERADRETAAERLRGDEMQRTLHDARADGDARVEAERQRAAAEHAARAERLQREVATVRAESDMQTARIAQLDRDLAEARTESAQHAARAAELEREAASARAQAAVDAEAHVGKVDRELTAARAEAVQHAARATALERELATASAEATARSAEATQLRHDLAAARTGAEGVVQLERDLTAARAETAQHAARVAELERELATSRAEAAARTAEATQLGHDLGAARTDAERAAQLERDLTGARAEATQHAARATELERELATARAEATARTTEATQLERDLATAHAEADTHLTRAVQLETDLAGERAARAADLAQFDAKLQTIVTHLASDHESDLGQALSDKEEARAEARALGVKVAALRETATDLERELATAHAEIDSHLTRAVQLETDLAGERAARAAEAAQFDTKLQTIVTHLASDHETDLGQALSDKEEARAEARALGVKLAALQRKYEEQHEAAEALLRETRSAAQAEIERLRKQVAPRTPRPLILVVHPDAELRNAAGATLGRAGYEVVGAADGLEALRVAIARQPEIVIAESSMPKMDGRELCQLLKSQEKTAHIRFVLLMRGSDKAPQGELVPDEVLRKPVPVETLKSTLASLLAPAHTR